MTYRGAHIRASDGDEWFLTTVSEVSHLDTTADGLNCENIAVLIDSWTCLLADSPLNLSTRSDKPLRLFRRFRGSLLNGPLLEFVKRYSKLADEIVKETTLTGADTYTGVFVDAMRDTPIFREYLTWYRDGDPEVLQFILTFLWFGKKMDYEDPSFDATAFRGWSEVEEKLSSLEFNPNILHDLRRIMAKLTEKYEYCADWTKFGPGAVSEIGVRGVIRKSNNVLPHPKLERLLFKSPRMVTRTGGGDGVHKYDILPDVDLWTKAKRTSSDVSTLRFVPKDVTKSRSICMEPNSFMWAQQSVLDSLIRMFRDGEMKRFVDLSDQSRNRDLARFGSYTSELDTIDLSSASDSVSVDLIRAIMPRKVWHSLLATRTSKVQLPSGDVVRVKKFAPMGSAVCFPTQCLVFTSVAILAALQESEGIADGNTSCLSDSWFSNFSRTLSRLFAREPGYYHHRRQFQPLAVYGDDIVIDTRLTARTVHLLSTLGFSVNSEKSFTGGCAFRESCGGYYWGGYEVTPLRFKVKRIRAGNPSGHVASVVSLANRAGDRKYLNLRRLLIHRGQQKAKFIAFSSDPCAGLTFYSLNPRNTHLRRRYNKDLQRDEVWCTTLLPKKYQRARRSETDAYERYLYGRWWASRRGDVVTSEENFGVARFDTSGTRLGRRWIPAE